MKIAVLSDLHLSDGLDESHLNVLREALKICRENNADVIACAGDMVKAGACAAASFLIESLKKLPLPIVVTKGNTEDGIDGIDELIKDLRLYISQEVEVLTTEAEPPPDSKSKFRILVGHYPMRTLPCNVDLQIAGHLHRDSSNGKIEIVRGLDPDKVIGGPPAVAFFEIENGRYNRKDVSLKGFTVAEWSKSERMSLFRQIGVAIKVDPVEELNRAVELNMPAVEVLYNLLKNEKCPSAIANYLRETKGVLSIHLPDISFEKPDAVLEYIKKAVDLGTKQFTLHVPKVSIQEMAKPGNFDQICDFYCHAISAAPDAVFGIENMHMVSGESEFDRRFGYTPDEQMSIIRKLRHLIPNRRIGAVLDIGHARNNGVFYQRYSLSHWYEALRGEIAAMHLHQVRQSPDGLHNHMPITGWYESLISLASFISEWKNGTFKDALLFVECRGGWESSYSLFKNELFV